ncbi:MAG: hypothetical protein N3G20_08705 [Verrucomicrobiae bacterium]|nr:hypothetical protein [Verrucomicrobiae bacterium]
MARPQMRIIITRFGGFAGIRKPPVVVDTHDLSPQEAAELERLISASRLFEIREGQCASIHADRFEYRIEIFPDEGQPHAFTISEANAPESLLELVAIVQQIGKRKKSTPETPENSALP